MAKQSIFSGTFFFSVLFLLILVGNSFLLPSAPLSSPKHSRARDIFLLNKSFVAIIINKNENSSASAHIFPNQCDPCHSNAIRLKSALLAASSNGSIDGKSARELLGLSFNSDPKGSVPLDPLSVATEAVDALKDAIKKDATQKLFMIEIKLPLYNAVEGDDSNDQTVVMEFAKSLSDEMMKAKEVVGDDGNVPILVMDEDMERKMRQEVGLNLNSEDKRKEEVMINSDSRKDTSSNDIDRQQLFSAWESTDVDDDTCSSTPDISCRISSIFGNNQIRNGPDMFDDVCSIVDTNLKSFIQATDRVILILLPTSTPDMVACRRIIGLNRGKNKIIFINSKLDPLPRELLNAETVYSISALVAKALRSNSNDMEKAPIEPKVVVMRRYPRDWELYIALPNDDGIVDNKDFEQVDSISADRVAKNGPNNSWVTACVQKYMKFKVE